MNVIQKTDNNAGQPWNRCVPRPGSAPQHWGIKNPDMEGQRVVAKTYLKLKYNLFLRYLLKRIILSLSSVVGHGNRHLSAPGLPFANSFVLQFQKILLSFCQFTCKMFQ